MINIAIIGAGFMGKTHLEAYKTMPNVKVSGICDLNQTQGEELAKSANCEWFSDIEEMIKKVSIDVVDICLPTFLHEKFAVIAAENHKHIFCEKPVALNMDTFKNMANAAKKSGVKFAVGQAVRFWPEYVYAKKLYDNNEYGNIKYVHAGRKSVHPQWSEWYRRPENSGGGLFDLHLHDIDYLCYLLGRVKQVYAVGKQNDVGCWNYVASTLVFENGVSAMAEGIIEMPQGFPFTMQLSIVGDKKALSYEMKAGTNLEDVNSAKRETFIYGESEKPSKIEIEEYDAYKAELRYFVDCIENNREIEEVKIEDVEHVLSVILAIEASLKTGKCIEL